MTTNAKCPPKLRLLIGSVGSVVGRNILDCLEYPAFNRRHLVHVAGTNSVAEAPNNFRCDECFLVPPTASPEYPERMKQVLHEVKPDVVLCGRDADTAAIHRLLQADNTLPGKLPYGSLESILIALDKLKTFQFCQEHGLPFADSFVLGRSGDLDDLHAFADRNGYPLIAKPIEGFRSSGVVFVRSRDELRSLSEHEGYIFQEYLGDRDALDDYFRSLEGPVPLFSEAPGMDPHNSFVIIGPDGSIGDIQVLHVFYHYGVGIIHRRVVHPEVEELTRAFAAAFYSEGGFGPLCLQFYPDRQGHQKAFEMNLRNTGATYALFLMGLDEIGIMINYLLPESNFPIVTVSNAHEHTITGKSSVTFAVEDSAVAALTRLGRWSIG